jgi:dGTPase
VLEVVAKQVGKQIGDSSFSAKDVASVFLDLFSQFVLPADDLSPGESDSLVENVLSALTYQQDLDAIAEDGHVRTSFTSYLVGRFINGVHVDIDEELPQLSEVFIEPETLKEIEVLKNFTYQATIRSNRVAVSEFRGKDIVKQIFAALDGEKGLLLLPSDFQALYNAATGNLAMQKRVLCDFIAGMTDRYAMEFWSRLYSESGETIFKPL